MLNRYSRYLGTAKMSERGIDDNGGPSLPKAGDWRQRMTITIPEYARIVGVGRNTAYEAARAGEVATIKVRGRVLVCVPALMRQLEGKDVA
jgi:hypothetical protein